METIANNEILAFLWLYRQIVWVTLSTMALLVIIIIWWDKVKYFFMNVGYSMPFIGKIARAEKDSQIQSKGDWLGSEQSLCDDYYKYYLENNKSVEHYKKCRDYLSKCQEIGRRKKGFLLSTLLIFLILFEAVGFAYVLAPFMVQNVSADDASMLAWFTAFLLSIAAVFLTDKTGEEIHKNSLIKKARAWWESDDEKKGDLKPNKTTMLEATYEDNDDKAYTQLLNRLETNHKTTPQNTVMIMTIIYILFIAIGAFFVRSYTLDSIETEMVNSASSPFVSSNSFSPNSSPFDLPSESKSFNQSADEQAGDEKKDALHMASLTTFVILSVIFVAIQVLGIMFGYLYSLSGRESALAWEDTKDFNSPEEYESYYQRKKYKVARDAQAKLSALQTSISKGTTSSANVNNAIRKGSGHKDFEQYLHEKSQKKKTNEIVKSTSNAEETVSPVQLDSIREEPKDNISQAEAVKKVEETSSETGIEKPIDSLKEKSIINDLGDISDYDDEDIAMLAEELGIEVDKLNRKKRIQKMANKARQ